jgi:hypothetical protein
MVTVHLDPSNRHDDDIVERPSNKPLTDGRPRTAGRG